MSSTERAEPGSIGSEGLFASYELDGFFDRFRIGGQWRLDLAQNALAGLTAAMEEIGRAHV